MEAFAQYLIAAGVLAIPGVLGWLAYELHVLRQLTTGGCCCRVDPKKLPCGYVVFIWDGNEWNIQVDECKAGCSAPTVIEKDGHYVGQCRVVECVQDGGTSD